MEAAAGGSNWHLRRSSGDRQRCRDGYWFLVMMTINLKTSSASRHITPAPIRFLFAEPPFESPAGRCAGVASSTLISSPIFSPSLAHKAPWTGKRSAFTMRPTSKRASFCSDPRSLSVLYYFRFSWRRLVRASVLGGTGPSSPRGDKEGGDGPPRKGKARELPSRLGGSRRRGWRAIPAWHCGGQRIKTFRQSRQADSCVMSRSELDQAIEIPARVLKNRSNHKAPCYARQRAVFIETNWGSRRTRYLALSGGDCRESLE